MSPPAHSCLLCQFYHSRSIRLKSEWRFVIAYPFRRWFAFSRVLAAGLLLLLPAIPATGQQTSQPPATSKPGPELTNDDIIKMTKFQFGEAVIISKIRTSQCRFDTEMQALVGLKEAGVSDTVIQAMVEAGAARRASDAAQAACKKSPPPDPNDPRSPHDPGIFVLREDREGSRMVQLEPTAYAQGKTGGVFASAMTYGIAKVKWKAVVRGGKASIRTSEPQPTFYFYFDQKASSMDFAVPWLAWFGGVSSPNQFVLARFEAKKDTRELVVGEWGAYSASTGTRGKDMVEFDFEKLAPGIYKVRPRADLRPGEYCFFYVSANMAYGAGGGQLFDIGVNPPR